MSNRVAVVTNASSGLGFALVRGLCQRFQGVVYLTSRDEADGLAAVAELNNVGLHPHYPLLDVSDRGSFEAFRDYIKEKHDGIDIFINNAVVRSSVQADDLFEETKNLMNWNYRSIVYMNEFIHLLMKENLGRILIIFSDCGYFKNVVGKFWGDYLNVRGRQMNTGAIGKFVDWYSQHLNNRQMPYISDLYTDVKYHSNNAVYVLITLILKQELRSRNVSVESMHPGQVRDNSTGNGDPGFYEAADIARKPLHQVLDVYPNTIVEFDKKVREWYDYVDDYSTKFDFR